MPNQMALQVYCLKELGLANIAHIVMIIFGMNTVLFKLMSLQFIETSVKNETSLI
jgi:hypothetical protein